MLRNDVAVVVPVYKETLEKNEKKSLTQLAKVLNKFTRILVIPKGLCVTQYLLFDPNLQIREFPKEFFEGIKGYNKLMLSKDFYGVFIDYEYILIYQLDGMVLSDTLMTFVEKRYDYIGAPWPLGQIDYQYNFRGARWLKRIFPWFNKLWTVYVGNGGISLRRVTTFLYVLNKFDNQVKKWKKNEDVFYSVLGVEHPDDFKVAPLELAAAFSMETFPEKCWEIAGKKLPFAVHAWTKYDSEFVQFVFKQAGMKNCNDELLEDHMG